MTSRIINRIGTSLYKCQNSAVQCMYSHQNYCCVIACWHISGYVVMLFMRIISPFMLLLANTLVLGIVYIWFIHFLPNLAGDSWPLYFLNLFIGMFLAFHVLGNYLACAFTPPGTPEVCDDPVLYFGKRMSGLVDGKPVYEVRHMIEIAPAVNYRFCRHCKCVKPPRTHHCSISGKCIMYMDHFCPWMNNCVGYYNYRYFVMFLFYMIVGSVYVVWFSGRELLAIPKANRHPNKVMSMEAAVFLTFTLGISAFFAVGILLVWHTYLCLTNQTTLEFYINYDEGRDAKARGETFKNPFDKGWRKNLRRVFGDVPWWRAALFSLRHPPEPEYPLLPPEANIPYSGLTTTSTATPYSGLAASTSASSITNGTINSGSNSNNSSSGTGGGARWQYSSDKDCIV